MHTNFCVNKSALPSVNSHPVTREKKIEFIPNNQSEILKSENDEKTCSFVI